MPEESKGILISYEAVEALKKLAESLPEAVEASKLAADTLDTSFEEKKELLGPHTAEMKAIIDGIADANATGRTSIIKVQTGLLKSAVILKGILDKKFGGGTTTP